MQHRIHRPTLPSRILEYGIYLFLFLLPWQTRWIWRDAFLNQSPWEYGTLSLYGTQLLLWLLIIVFGVVLFQDFQVRRLSSGQRTKLVLRRLVRDRPTQTYVLITALLAYVGVTTWWSYDQTVALWQWIIFVQAGVLMAMIVYGTVSVKRVAVALASAGVVQALLALWQSWQQIIVGNKWLGMAEHLPTVAGSIIVEAQSGRWLRAYGSFQHPNILGGFLVLALLMMIYLLVRSYRYKMLKLATITVLISGLLVSFSRSAWLAAAVIIVAVIVWMIRMVGAHRGKIIIALCVAVVVPSVLFGIVYSDAVASRLWPQTDLEYNSLDLRVTFIEQAWQVFTRTPLLGTGIGNYTHGVHAVVNSSWPGWYYQPVHNFYLLPFVELGVLGGILCLLIGIFIIRLCLLEIRSRQHFFVALGIVTIIIIGFTDHYFWTLYPGITLVFIFVGLLLQYKKSAPQIAHDA